MHHHHGLAHQVCLLQLTPPTWKYQHHLLLSKQQPRTMHRHHGLAHRMCLLQQTPPILKYQHHILLLFKQQQPW